MTLLPIAAFLAGALLSLLLPVALLIALTVWYWGHSARTPASDLKRDAHPDPVAEHHATHPAPSVRQTLPPEPGA